MTVKRVRRAKGTLHTTYTVKRAALFFALVAQTYLPARDAHAVPSDAPNIPSSTLVFEPSENGSLGAWLVSGPHSSSTTPDQLRSAEHGNSSTDTGGAPWTLRAQAEGPISLFEALGHLAKGTAAFASIDLLAQRAGTYHLILGSDDGLSVFVDGKLVGERNEVRDYLETDQFVDVPLTKGRHTLSLRFVRREAKLWRFHARIVGESWTRDPDLVALLPGAAAMSSDLLEKLATPSVERSTSEAGYRFFPRVRYKEGRPRGSTPVRFELDGVSPVRPATANTTSLDLTLPVDPITSSDVGSVESRIWRLFLRVGNRVVESRWSPRSEIRRAIALSERALKMSPLPCAPLSCASIQFLHDRLLGFANREEHQLDATLVDAEELRVLSEKMLSGSDPFAAKRGAQRRAFVSSTDGSLSEFALYVPTSYKESERNKLPLIVALHGMNGLPMSMLSSFFGLDDETIPAVKKDRITPIVGGLDAIVAAPLAFGNAMYRSYSEEDILQLIRELSRTYRIDENRISITGPSMGGIGTAALALRHPSLFSAAAPLCGYHSYFLRNDMAKKSLQPWERFLAEERSNVHWAENGSNLPLLIVHGTKDLPVANSGVLIDKYEKLGFSIEHEHPDLGHNVWTYTYSALRGAKWLTKHTRKENPPKIRFRTSSPRFGTFHWLQIDEIESPGSWSEGDVTLQSVGKSARVAAKLENVRAFTLERIPGLRDTVEVVINGQPLAYESFEPLRAFREKGTWKKGVPADTLRKRGASYGAFRELFRDPVTIVYGASDPAWTYANEEVARAFVRPRYGVTKKWRVVSDAEYLGTKDPSSPATENLFLVGNARSNKLVAAYEPSFPFKIDGEGVRASDGVRYVTDEAGVLFVHPHPSAPKYLVGVLEAPTVAGLYRVLSLPELLPDFFVYDHGVASARGEQVLHNATALRAGFFDADWKLPSP